ncbi:hypothetical protein GZH49_01670 [Nocardia terpenica]|uniref:hypothetical protein n=1 Tax=Nocardia terpenica TaxID=455432 RepID=UPI002FE34E01
MIDPDDERDWVTAEDTAARLGVTTADIYDMARRRILRSRRTWGVLQVEPAIVNRGNVHSGS